MYNEKVKCTCSMSNSFTTGKIYNVVNGKIFDNNDKIHDESCTVNDILDLNNKFISKFEEVKPDKIGLLSEDGYSFIKEPYTYTINKNFNYYSLNVSKKNSILYVIRWGEGVDNTLEDVKPILDALNIEIIEEPPKYTIDSTKEYTEEETKELEKLGIKFKKVVDNK